MRKLLTMIARQATNLCKMSTKTISCDICAYGEKLININPTSDNCGSFDSEEKKREEIKKEFREKEIAYIEQENEDGSITFIGFPWWDDGFL